MRTTAHRRPPSAIAPPLRIHAVAALFPDLSPSDYASLLDDIRQHGVKLPILVWRGEILDGRHRYRACRELGIPCPMQEWNGRDPWFEVQSRNLVRRHLAKEQIYAIRKLAAAQYPELATEFAAARADAERRKAQAPGQPRGVKALSRSCDLKSESADVIGACLGVSGATVKRVDRLAKLAPALLAKVATGELSATKGLRQAAVAKPRRAMTAREASFDVHAGLTRLRQIVRTEWRQWPVPLRERFLRGLSLELQALIAQTTISGRPADDSEPGQGS
jgi:hypothetical protein